MLIDSHAHIDSERYTDDRAAVLERAYAAGVETILAIGIGENAREMGETLRICRQFNGRAGMPRLYATAGVYPHNAGEINEQILAEIDALLAEPEVIGCGEIGLDYFHEGAAHEVQRTGLMRQLEVAAGRRRPVAIHCRPKDGQQDAWEHLFEILEAHWRGTGLGGILHCFSGTAAIARRAMEMGFLISFAGNLTYPKAQPLRDAAAAIPLESLLVETDAPWLAPAANRGKRNEPAWVTETARVLAGLQQKSVEEVATATTKNFNRLFDLPPDMGN